MGGKTSRTKGHSYEREIAKRLREEGLYPEAKRHLEVQRSECKGYDLDNTPPFKIQCKRNKKYAPITKLEEPVPDLEEGEVPLLITKGDRQRDVVCLYLDDFIELLHLIKISKEKELV